MVTRILWNRRPANPSDAGDIDEIVVRRPKAVHIEQRLLRSPPA